MGMLGRFYGFDCIKRLCPQLVRALWQCIQLWLVRRSSVVINNERSINREGCHVRRRKGNGSIKQ